MQTQKEDIVKKTTGILAVIAALLLAVTAIPAAYAQARRDIPALAIGAIGYNAVGPDRVHNRNQEYIDVSNVSGAPVDVKGLVVEDSWARSHRDSNPKKCNTWTIDALPGVTEDGDGKLMLQPGHTIRVYVGQGVPTVFADRRIHAVYMNHGLAGTRGCGYFGHFLNNSVDTVSIRLGDSEESRGWDFRRGYWVR